MRKIYWTRCLAGLYLILMLPTLGFTKQADFQLTEHIGRAWNHEFITFPLSESQRSKIQQGAVLITGSESIPFQILGEHSKQPRIGFHVDMQPFSQSQWRLGAGAKPNDVESPIRVNRNRSRIEIDNGLTGIRISRGLNDGVITGIRLRSGEWVTTSELDGKNRVKSWKLEVLEEGPLFVEVKGIAKLANGGAWNIRFRMFAGEEIILVDESFTGSKGVALKLQIDKDFDPDQMFYRLGKMIKGGRVGKNVVNDIDSGDVFVLEPWLKWWESERQGAVVSFFDESGEDMLSIAARSAGVWVDPERPVNEQAEPRVPVTNGFGGLQATFPLGDGQRAWMIGVYPVNDVLKILEDNKKGLGSPIPYQHLIKHDHFPLEQVKDYVLQWETSSQHPRLLVSSEDLEQYRQRPHDLNKIKYSNRSQKKQKKQKKPKKDRPIRKAQYQKLLSNYLKTGDEEVASRLVTPLLKEIQQAVDFFFEQKSMPYGASPHQQHFLSAAVSNADILMGSGKVDSAGQQRIRAQVAFLSYTLNRSEYWSEDHGYSANPNMSTTVDGYRLKLAAFLGDHPRSKQWASDALTNLQTKLKTWSDDNGGWLEAPHYAVVAFDDLLGMLVISHNAGINDWLFTDKRIRKVARWLGKIATPPDSRIGGYRHHPAIGNTYVNEPTGEYGLLAYLFRERDPEFSAEMQWLFAQSNFYLNAGIGSGYPAFKGVRDMLTDKTLPQRAPNYRSEVFPKTGVVLRDNYPSDRETYLHMIQGENHEHYDFDSGSIVVYGKGRVIADEFGYTGRAPESEHNMVDALPITQELMKLTDTSFGERFDYIEGSKGSWTRQIVFVKGQSSYQPAYFLIKDSLTGWPGSWRLWLTAQQVDTKQNPVRVIGNEDVDTELYFLNIDTDDLEVEKLEKRAGSGLYPNWTWKAMTTEQIGLSHAGMLGLDVTFLLYPRLKGVGAPKITPIAGEKGVKVEHEHGTDWVFLHDKSFRYKGDGVKFRGKAGMVQSRGGQVVTATDSNGAISYR